ncbi:hypothetical protein R3P38DRAFT_2503291 [Favolaschia claudopus]|uniref:Zn(2)-C6 fungal-type domain-containing protein n=1 Tax=Favolaschia claudopus TaxID=2862362 RepID=A0AAW0DJ94_9AGAR
MDDSTRLPPSFLPPIFLTRRRVIIACTNCRKRKVRCLTPEDPPSSPCDRCIKKGLKCEYVTISNQRDEASTNKSAPVESESSRSHSSSPPVGAHRRGGSQSTRPVDPHWMGDANPHARRQPAPGNLYSNQAFPSASHSQQAYNNNNGQMGGYPSATSATPRPYFDPNLTLPPIRRYTSQDILRAPVADSSMYGASQWDRCGVCPLGYCQCGWQRR